MSRFNSPRYFDLEDQPCNGAIWRALREAGNPVEVKAFQNDVVRVAIRHYGLIDDPAIPREQGRVWYVQVQARVKRTNMLGAVLGYVWQDSPDCSWHAYRGEAESAYARKVLMSSESRMDGDKLIEVGNQLDPDLPQTADVEVW